MYLVELRPGKEELYRSSDELALAIRSGDVDARSRVYHRATAKWISITLHPQYKAIIAAVKEDSATRPSRKGWAILGGGGGADQPNQAASPEPPPTGGQLLHRWRRPLALGVAGLLLMSGIQLAFSGPRPQWSHRARVAATAEKAAGTAKAETTEVLVQTAGEGTESAEVTLYRDEPALISLVSTRTARRLPKAPRLQPRSLGEALMSESVKEVKANSPEGLLARYTAAHDSARARLETGMRVARLDRMFAAPRLSASGGVTGTRMSLAGVANFIRLFREQQAMIEAAYQDSVTMLAKAYSWSPRRVRRWYSRVPEREGSTLELLSGSLIATIDSVLGVLANQAGAYKIRGSAIAFEDPTAGQAYGALRRRIKEQIDAAVAAGGATIPGATRLLLQAIGTSTLPRET
jgi:hypothetical protein